MKIIIWGCIVFVFAVFYITVVKQNGDLVDVNYTAFVSFKISTANLIFVSFFSGAFFGVLFMTLSVFKQRLRVSAERRKLVKVEKEVENLRAMPLKDEV